MTKYLTVDEYRSFTNLQDSEYSDAAITLAINSAESFFDNKVGFRDFNTDSGEVIEYIDGDGNDYTFTKKFPIKTFSSLLFDKDSDDVFDTLVEDTDFVVDLDTGKIDLIGDDYTTFTSYKRNIKATYTPGVSSTPDQVMEIIQRMVTNILNKLRIDMDVESDIKSISEIYKR